jgi:hypothetical protein
MLWRTDQLIDGFLPESSESEYDSETEEEEMTVDAVSESKKDEKNISGSSKGKTTNDNS